MRKHSVPLAQALIISSYDELSYLFQVLNEPSTETTNLSLFSTFCKVSQEQEQEQLTHS